MQETRNAPHLLDLLGEELYGSSFSFTVRGRHVNPWLALAALCPISLTSLFDAKALHIALPSIQAALKTDLGTASWVITISSLITAILFIPVGRFADQYGRKRLLLGGLLIFGAGSGLCTLSPVLALFTHTPPVYWLIGFRAVQAIGSTLHVVVLATIMALFAPGQRGKAIGIYIACSGCIQIGGPLLGGALISHLNWIWFFFMGLPCSLAALVLVVCFVPETSTHHHHTSPTDWPGIITLSIALLCLILSIQGNSWGWSSIGFLMVGGIALIALLLFVLIERRQPAPLLDLQIFRLPSFLVANLIACLDGLAVPGTLLLLSYYLIALLGYNQIHTALILLSVSAATLVAIVLASFMSTRLPTKLIVSTSLALLAPGLFLLSILSFNAGESALICGCTLIGAGMGLMAQSLPALVLSEVPRAKLGAGSGVFTTCGQLCSALGVPLLLSIFLSQAQVNTSIAQAQAIQVVQTDTLLPASMRTSIVTHLATLVVRGESSTQVNLTSFAGQFPDSTPPQMREEINRHLAELNTRVNTLFKMQLMHAYHATWQVAALIILVAAVIPGITFVSRRTAATWRLLLKKQSGRVPCN